MRRRFSDEPSTAGAKPRMGRTPMLLLVLALTASLAPTPAQAITSVWYRLVGTSTYDRAWRAQTLDGNIYVAGSTRASLAGQPFAGDEDAYIRALTSTGTTLWTAEFGSAGGEFIYGMDVDATGVYVAGFTTGDLDGPSLGSRDAVLRRYDLSGNLKWSRQFGTDSYDQANDVVFHDGDVFVVGYTSGDMGKVKGGGDAFVRAYSKSGNELWTKQFGTSSYDETVAIDARKGVLYLGGKTQGMLGNKSFGDYDGFVRTMDTSGIVDWTKQFGSSGIDYVEGISVAGAGPIAASYTNGTVGAANLGGYDGVAYALDKDGAKRWATQVGSGSSDYARDVFALPGGGALLAGHTAGALPGKVNYGGEDGFLIELDGSGTSIGEFQVGTGANDYLYGVGAGRVTAGVAGAAIGGQAFAGGGGDGMVWQTS